MWDKLKTWVINDYFTPNIKAEVILDTLLTPYVAEIINRQCGLETVFVTKEMSILDESRRDNRGEKIDYILAGVDAVYMVELKTTKGSIKPKQARKYWLNCEGKTFKEVFGRKLLSIVSKRTGTALDNGSEDEAQLRILFETICAGIEGTNCSERAKNLLKKNHWDSTYKYLYTMGQLLDYLNSWPGRTIWDLPLKLLYLTPNGNEPHRELMDHPEFYLHPEGMGSLSLWAAAADLKQGDELASLLAELIDEIHVRGDTMKNIVAKMESTSGTVFLYCSSKDEKSIHSFTQTAERTGRRLFSREDCQTLEPVALASSHDKKAIFVSPSMMDFLDRYLSACPAGQRHLLIHAHRQKEKIRSMSYLFHDFWEERDVNIEDFFTEI